MSKRTNRWRTAQSAAIHPLGRWLLVLCLASAEAFAAGTDAIRDFERWFSAYRYGKTESALNEQLLEAVFHRIEHTPGESSAALLLDAAVFQFSSDPWVEKQRFAALQPWAVRERAIRALARLEDDGARHYLQRTMLLARSSATAARRVAAARALALNPRAPDTYFLQHGLLDKEADVRVACLLGLRTMAQPASLVPAASLLGDADEGVRVAAATTVAALLGQLAADDPPFLLESALARMRGALADASWRVRLVVAECLRQVRARDNVPALVSALARETVGAAGARERVRVAIHRALTSLTGVALPMNQPQSWASWWDANQAKFRLAPEPKTQSFQAPKYPHLFDIPLNSDRLVFVLDVSGSMGQALPRAGETMLENGARVPSKYDRLVQEMTGALNGMAPTVEFEIILFNERVHRLFKDLRRATPENKAIALNWLKSIQPLGGTNLFGGLEAALGIGPITGVGRYFGTGADTLVVLSDGEPTVGAIVEPSQISNVISEANAIARVQIHTISFGNSPLLRELARRNEGEHRAIQ